VVVNWNRKELLRACLASLERQTGVEFETIVVDNGSTDGSAEMAEREFGRCVIRNAENRGFCAANNQGIAAARGEFIALLNNDAEAEPAGCGARARLFGAGRRGYGRQQSAGVGRPWAHRQSRAPDISRWTESRAGSGTEDRGQYDREEEVLWPDGCAAYTARKCWSGSADSTRIFFAYGDDAELGLRARIAG